MKKNLQLNPKFEPQDNFNGTILMFIQLVASVFMDLWSRWILFEIVWMSWASNQSMTVLMSQTPFWYFLQHSSSWPEVQIMKILFITWEKKDRNCVPGMGGQYC